MIKNLCKLALQANGNIIPLKFSSEESGHTGIMNPSIFWDGDNLLTNLRNVQYSLYHSEFGQNFQNHWGCLAYLNPEDDITLRTKNYLSKNNEPFKLVDTSKLDVKPIWEFIGLEDARVVVWEGKTYLIGVRRDTTTNGVGRMEFSEIVDGKEVNRYRIEPPNGYTYCEKNWMPILDMPFHFVKWSNPTEVVKVNLETLSSETIVLKEQPFKPKRDLRGGSQVISHKGFYICVTHEVDLWKNQKGNKDCHYYHRVLVWDKDWNLIKVTPEFKFMDAKIEFCCGLAFKDNKFLISFGFQDTSAFVLEMPESFFESFINGEITETGLIVQDTKLNTFISDVDNSAYNHDLALEYYYEGHYSSAISFFLRSAEIEELKSDEEKDKNFVYLNLLLIADCLGKLGRRHFSHKTAILNAIAYLPKRYEAHYLLSQWYEPEKDYIHCYSSAKTALELFTTENAEVLDILDIKEYKIKFQIAFSAWWVGLFDKSRKMFFDISNEYGLTMDEKYRKLVQGNITRLGSGDAFLTFNKDMHDSLNFKFENSETIERNYSQTYQDMFALYVANGKKNGTYIEIGSADPSHGSNTKLLEEAFDWKGVGIEILPEEVAKHETQRKNPVLCVNALEVNYDELLSQKAEEFGNNGFFDYLQVDCEPPSVSFDILKMIPFDKFKFGVVTFEHDFYADLSKSIREESREYMKSKGYVLAIGNVSMNDDCAYEDWWVHPEYIDSERLNKIINNDTEVVNMGKFMLDYK